MTELDKSLIKEAEQVKYWRYQEVYPLIEKAETEECKVHLNRVLSMLFDYYYNEL